MLAKPVPELTLQVPPLAPELVTVTVEPIHAVEGVGLIVPANGSELTVTTCDAAQPVDNV